MGVNFTIPLVQSTHVPEDSNDAKDNIQFYQQICTQLYLCTELEVTPNFYALHSMPYDRKISVNLLVQKLLIKPTGAKCKCTGAQHLVQKDAVQFHHQNSALLY